MSRHRPKYTAALLAIFTKEIRIFFTSPLAYVFLAGFCS